MGNRTPLYKLFRNIASGGREYSEETRQWMDDASNKKIYRDLLNVWRVMGNFPNPFSPDKQKAWHKVQYQIHSQRPKYFLYKKIATVAAACIVIFLSVWLGTEINRRTYSTLYTEVISPAGQKTRVVLPDGSAVMLNGASHIRYSNNFGEHDRTIVLQGEGYFDVKKDLSKQFIVQTAAFDINVYGTSFNVKAYDDDQMAEVGLKEGKIGIGRSGKKILQLDPGQAATFNYVNKKLAVQKVNVDLLSAWTRNEMAFDEKPMAEIVKYMERWYGVKIKIAPELLDGQLYTFIIKTESLQEALRLIDLLKPIKYTVNGTEVIVIKP
jgi:ferric-dicitrate binding protein FerR (iron transport regulator)